MKQDLRFRGCYCPKRIRPIYLIHMVMLLLTVGGKGAFAQNPYAIPDTIKPLAIGETIPEWLWQMPLQVVNHPEGKDTIALNEYRDKKLIVLDFWATWCKPCIRSLLLLDSFQRERPGELALIPILARDRAGNALRFIRERNWNGFTVVQDTLLDRTVFPHSYSLPKYIWLHKGRVTYFSESGDPAIHGIPGFLVEATVSTPPQNPEMSATKPLSR